MPCIPVAAGAGRLGVLLRGEPDSLREWCSRWEARRTAFCLVVILIGAGCYGAAMGCWRVPRQALFVAVKFPLIILLTAFGNATLNAMLAPLLGLNLSFRQSVQSVLMSFMITSAILGSFSPLVAFMVWNAPTMVSARSGTGAVYGAILLAHVLVIAFAGCAGNFRLRQLLQELSGSAATAHRVLLAWLVGNLFLGSQLSWILRPFIGSPMLPVEFLRPDAFKGNFYETVLHTGLHLLSFD